MSSNSEEPGAAAGFPTEQQLKEADLGIDNSGSGSLSIWASWYAKTGFHVFRLGERAKVPLSGSHGHKDATTDRAIVEAWWREMPTANIGWSVGDDGIVVFDCDVKEDDAGNVINGEESLMLWCEQHGIEWPLPSTLQQQTGGGGTQFFFRLPVGVEVRSRNGVLSSVDVKSSGGYVVVAPSIHPSGGAYVWSGQIDSVQIANVPEALLGLLTERRSDSGDGYAGLDAESFLSGVPEGRRDDECFSQAVRQLRQGVQPAVVEGYVLTGARNCSPPFPDEQARAKVAQAIKWVSEHPNDPLPEWTPGGLVEDDATRQAFERRVLEEMQKQRVRDEARERLRRRRDGGIVVMDSGALLDMPRPSWLVGGLLPTTGTFQVYGGSSVGKSFVVQDLLLAAASGTADWLGHFPVMRSGPVVYVAGEGGWDLGVRVEGWAKARGVPVPVNFFGVVEQGVDLRSRDDVREITEACRERGAVAVVFDTWALHMPGGDENSAKDAGEVIDAVKTIAVDLGALVGTVHHTGKEVSRGARGSSAMRAAWDVEFSFDGRLLTQTKNRYGPQHPAIGIEMTEAGDTLVPQRVDAFQAALAGARDLHEKIVGFVRLNPGCNVTAIEVAIASGATTRKAITQLLDEGVLRDEGSGKPRQPKVLFVADGEAK